jgi:hypothetical protein
LLALSDLIDVCRCGLLPVIAVLKSVRRLIGRG